MAMKRAGYDVFGICSPGPDVKPLRREGLTLYPVTILRRVGLWPDVRALFGMVRLFRRCRPDIVHTHTPKAAFLGQVAAWLARVPVRVNTVHGFYFVGQKNRLAGLVYKALELFACRLASHVLSQSREDVDMAVREGLIPRRKLDYLGNGIDVETFCRDRFASDEGGLVRQELGVPPDAFVVGIVARMVREKGFVELFEAFARLRKSMPAAWLIQVGPVDRSRGDQITPEMAADFGIAECCTFLGTRGDVPRLMTAMDVYCLPSHREGYPRSVMEANAMGLPAVVTDIRGCREAVIDGVNGLLVPVRDANALAAAMIRLYQHEELRARLAEGARERAAQAFDERRVFRVILNAYERLLRRKGIRPPCPAQSQCSPA